MTPDVGNPLHTDVHLLAAQGAMDPYMVMQAEDEAWEALVEREGQLLLGVVVRLSAAGVCEATLLAHRSIHPVDLKFFFPCTEESLDCT